MAEYERKSRRTAKAVLKQSEVNYKFCGMILYAKEYL